MYFAVVSLLVFLVPGLSAIRRQKLEAELGNQAK